MKKKIFTILLLILTVSIITSMIVISKIDYRNIMIGTVGVNKKAETTIVGTWDVSENEDGSVTATLDSDGLLTISGTGNMKDYTSDSNRPYDSAVSNITSAKINSGVTSIGKKAFDWCINLTSVEIPNGVTKIGNDAFCLCEKLTSVTIPNTVTEIGWSVFASCKNLTSITIPNSVTSIGGGTFSNCKSLTSIEIPSSVRSIGEKLVVGSDSLTNINVDSNNQYYSSKNGILFNKSGTVIKEYPKGKTDTIYVIPDNVTVIGAGAFSGCRSLTSITIPNSVETIENNSFEACSSLTNIEIPNSVTSLDSSFANSCKSLTSITIPANAMMAPNRRLFDGCSNLANIYVDSNNQYYLSENGVLFNKDKTEIIRYPEGKTNSSYTIPSSVASIGEEAFWACKNLTSITILSSVTSIGNLAFGDRRNTTITIYGVKGSEAERYVNDANDKYIVFEEMIVTTVGTWDISKNADGSVTATLDSDGLLTISGTGNMKGYNGFSDCPFYSEKPKITRIKINSGVTSIGKMVFYNCGNLTRIEIPNTVTSIGDDAFEYCTKLNNIEIPNTVTSIGDYAFCNCEKLTSIEISDCVTNIGYCAFLSCTSLTSINIDSNNQNYSSENGVLFNKNKTEIIRYPEGKTNTSYTIPSSVINIRRCAFRYCISLTSVEIPNSVTSIGELAFGSRKNTTIIIHGVKGSEAERYVNDANDEYIVFEEIIATAIGTWDVSLDQDESVIATLDSDGLLTISGTGNMINPGSISGYPYYSEKDNIKSVKIDSGVTSIGTNSFDYCSNLTNINVDSNNQNYSSENGVLFSKDKTKICRYPEGKTDPSYIIPNNVTRIRHSAFRNCTNLTSIEIPNGVTEIEQFAFSSCERLTNVEIPNGVTYIGFSTFGDCKNLTSIEIPNSVISINNSAFNQCTRLESVTIPNSVTNIEASAFRSCFALTSVTIPSSVTSIGNEAFGYRSNNTITIYGVKGSEAERYVNDANDEYIVFAEIGNTTPEDTIVPTVSITRDNYNTFSWTASDNVGVTGYQITRNNAKPSATGTGWLTDKTSGTYEIESNGIYYVWAKDSAGNVSDTKSITAYTLTKTQGANTLLTIRENNAEGIEIASTRAVLRGTKIYVTASADEGYTVNLTVGGTSFRSGSTKQITANTEVKTTAVSNVPTTPSDDTVYLSESDGYRITLDDNSQYLYRINPNTTVKNLKSMLDTNGQVYVYKLTGKTEELVENNENIGTGMIVKIKGNEETLEFKACVKGDVDGNGRITATDLAVMKQQMLREINVNNVQYMSLDISNDSKVSATDLAAMKQVLLNELDISKVK